MLLSPLACAVPDREAPLTIAAPLFLKSSYSASSNPPRLFSAAQNNKHEGQLDVYIYVKCATSISMLYSF